MKALSSGTHLLGGHFSFKKCFLFLKVYIYMYVCRFAPNAASENFCSDLYCYLKTIFFAYLEKFIWGMGISAEALIPFLAKYLQSSRSFKTIDSTQTCRSFLNVLIFYSSINWSHKNIEKRESGKRRGSQSGVLSKNLKKKSFCDFGFMPT